MEDLILYLTPVNDPDWDKWILFVNQELNKIK